MQPGDLTVTTNPQTVSFVGILKDTKRVYIRGYALFGAPMAAGAPLFPQVNVIFDPSKVRHPDRQTTNSQTRGHALILTGANTYQEYQTPRYLGYLHAGAEELRSLEVQVQTPAGATTDGAGNPLFSTLVLDLLFDVEPYELNTGHQQRLRPSLVRDNVLPY